jgi:hypothetical protein
MCEIGSLRQPSSRTLGENTNEKQNELEIDVHRPISDPKPKRDEIFPGHTESPSNAKEQKKVFRVCVMRGREKNHHDLIVCHS